MFFSLDNFTEIWILKSLFIDSLRYISSGELDIGLKRYVQIDIDDIFVCEPGARMVKTDVLELIQLQDALSRQYFIHNDYKFKFNIGFTGYYYESGNEIEDEGDRHFIGYFILNFIFNFISDAISKIFLF